MSTKTVGHMIMQWDDSIQQWKPISQGQTTWNPWFYSKTAAEQVCTNLYIKDPDAKYKIAVVTLKD